MSLSSITDWKTFVPASKVEKRQGYFEIPAFDYDVAWDGASRIVVQFNYSAPRNFTIFRNLTKPANPNFVPCIKYRVDDTVYRYKLWDDANCTVDAPLYVSQLIKKNFCLEIWNLSDETSVSYALVQQLLSSILTSYTDVRVHSNYKAATESDPVDDELLIPVTPSFGPFDTPGTFPNGLGYSFMDGLDPANIPVAGAYIIEFKSGAFLHLIDGLFYANINDAIGDPTVYFTVDVNYGSGFNSIRNSYDEMPRVELGSGYVSQVACEAANAGAFVSFNVTGPCTIHINWTDFSASFNPANTIILTLKNADWALPITFGNPSAWLNNV